MMTKSGTMLSGRGLWYGAVDDEGRNLVFTRERWYALCTQAKAWGITVVHPKVADGANSRYNDLDMQMLQSVAESHGLLCVPYVYSYGNALGALEAEKQLYAHIASLFGCLCLKMEEQWETYQSIAWATDLGMHLRTAFQGPLYVTSFGQPAKHPSIPWLTLNTWMTGFLPQVYWSEWNEGNVDVIIPRVYAQWRELDKHCQTIQRRSLAPIFPLIELGQSLSQLEVGTWLQKMGGYGYCGFWHAETYAPYANLILKSPLPVRCPARSESSTFLHEDSFASLPVPMSIDVSSEFDVHQGHVGEYATRLDVPAVASTIAPVQDTGGHIPMQPTTMREPVTPLPPSLDQVPVPEVDDPYPQVPDVFSLGAPAPAPTPLTMGQLRILWQSIKPAIPFDEGSPVVKRWCTLVEEESGIGIPLEAEAEIVVDDERIRFVPCSSGKKIVYFYALRRTLVV